MPRHNQKFKFSTNFKFCKKLLDSTGNFQAIMQNTNYLLPKCVFNEICCRLIALNWNFHSRFIENEMNKQDLWKKLSHDKWKWNGIGYNKWLTLQPSNTIYQPSSIQNYFFISSLHENECEQENILELWLTMENLACNVLSGRDLMNKNEAVIYLTLDDISVNRRLK